MTKISVDLVKNPDVAALVADMEPGDKVYGCFTVVSRDSQTAELRIEDMQANKKDLPDEDSTDDEDMMEDDTESTPDKSPEGKEAEVPETEKPSSVGHALAEQMNGGSLSF